MDGRWGVFEWVLFAAAYAAPLPLLVRFVRHHARGIPFHASRAGRMLRWGGLAMATSVLYLLGVSCVGWGFVHPYFSARAVASKSTCQRNLKYLSQALAIYAQDWNDRLPPASHWAGGLAKYVPNEEIFRCPAAGSPFSYGFNRALDALPLGRVEAPTDTVMLFESDAPDRNRSGGSATLSRPRHAGGWDFAWADAHVSWVSEDRLARLYWDPRTAPAQRPGP